MKSLRMLAIGVLGFGLGLGTGVTWTEKRQKETAGAGPVGPTKVTARSAPAPTVAGNVARAREESRRVAQQEKIKSQNELALQAKPLVEAALQLDDAKLRAKTIDDIRKALSSSDPAQVMIGFSAFTGLYELDFDKASFRNLILPHLENADESLRESAWAALMMSGLQDGDAARMRQVAKTMGMGQRTSYYLYSMESGDLTGESGEIVRGLLDGNDPDSTREVVRGIWGAKFQPQLEADLIQLSRRPEFLHDTVYFALSTQQNKSAATVSRLIEVLGDADSTNNGGRAAWGLGQGVSPELAPVVADAAAKIVSSRTSGYLTQQAWSLLERYAGPGQLEAMRALAAKPNLPEQRRKQVNELVARIGGPKN